MKNLRKPLVYVALALVPMLFSKCTLTEDLNKLGSSLDSVKVMIGSPEFKNTIHFEFVDAKTKEYITGKVLSLKVTGNGKLNVFDNIGNQAESYTTSNGILDLVVDPHIDSAYLAANPLRVNVTPTIDGYLSQTQQVEVSYQRVKNVIVSLVSLTGSNPVGVKVSTQNLAPSFDSQGKTTSSIVQQIDGLNTTIELQQGTTLKSTTGAVLKGTVSSQVVYFSPKDPATQAIIQGSLIGEAQLDKNNPQTTQGKLVSAGMVAAQLNVGGVSVKTFDGAGLKLKTRVASDLFNPDKNRVIALGDTIPMWSQEEGTGKWVLEKKSLVKSDADGLYLEDIVNHLSYWNWDWFTHSTGKDFCYYPNFPKIYWNLSGASQANVNVIVTLNGVSSQYPTMYEYIYQGAYSEFGYFPVGASGTVNFVDANPVPGRKLVFSPTSIPFTNLCGTNNTVNVTAVYDNDVLDVNLDLTAKSTDPASKISIKPNAYLNYKLNSSSKWNSFYLKNGLSKISLKIGQPYTITGNFGKNVGQGTIVVSNYGTNQLQVTLTPTMNYSEKLQAGVAIPLPPIAKPANNIVDVVFTILLAPDVFDKLK